MEPLIYRTKLNIHAKYQKHLSKVEKSALSPECLNLESELKSTTFSVREFPAFIRRSLKSLLLLEEFITIISVINIIII